MEKTQSTASVKTTDRVQHTDTRQSACGRAEGSARADGSARPAVPAEDQASVNQEPEEVFPGGEALPLRQADVRPGQ